MINAKKLSSPPYKKGSNNYPEDKKSKKVHQLRIKSYGIQILSNKKRVP